MVQDSSCDCREIDSVAWSGQWYMYSGSLSLVVFLEIIWESNALFSMDGGKIRLVGISS